MNEAPFEIERLREDSKLPLTIIRDNVEKLVRRRLVLRKDGAVSISSEQRLKLAIHVVKLGGDFERACQFLQWGEFESLAAEAFSVSGFQVKKRFRFTSQEKRREIDILGFREPLIVCVDCKHWRRGWSRSSVAKAVEKQLERTEMLAENPELTREKLGVKRWRQILLLPTVLSLLPAPSKFYSGVPVVPVLAFRSFLNDVEANLDALTYFKV